MDSIQQRLIQLAVLAAVAGAMIALAAGCGSASASNGSTRGSSSGGSPRIPRYSVAEVAAALRAARFGGFSAVSRSKILADPPPKVDVRDVQAVFGWGGVINGGGQKTEAAIVAWVADPSQFAAIKKYTTFGDTKPPEGFSTFASSKNLLVVGLTFHQRQAVAVLRAKIHAVFAYLSHH